MAFNGLEALEILEKQEVDLILLDLIMPYLDGLGVMHKLKEKQWPGRVVVISALGSEEMVQLTFSLGASYYLIKPFTMETLLSRLKMFAGRETEREEKPVSAQQEPDLKLDQAISELLNQVGVPPNFKGYLYLRDCIKLVAKDFDRLGSIMKTVYPVVAEKYNTTPQKIERTIRHALEVTWERGNLEMLNELFSNTIDADRGKATNTLFIAKLADEIRLKFSLS